MPIIIYAILETRLNKEQIFDFIEWLSLESSIHLELISSDQLSAVVSIYTEETSSVSKNKMLTYAGIIEKLAQKYSILPMRFGSVVSDYADVKTLLSKNSESFYRLLKIIIDKEEYSLRIIFSQQQQYSHLDSHFNEESSEIDQSLPRILLGDSENKRYLLNKYKKHILDEKRSYYIEKIKSLVISDLHKITEFIVFNKTQNPAFIIDAVILIEKSAIIELIAFVTNLKSVYPEHNVILTGPWPPYNFAQIKLK